MSDSGWKSPSEVVLYFAQFKKKTGRFPSDGEMDGENCPSLDQVKATCGSLEQLHKEAGKVSQSLSSQQF